MNKYLKYSILCVMLITLVATAYLNVFSAKGKEDSNDESSYGQVQVTKGDIKVTASGSGNIQPSISKTIQTLENGIVDKILIQEGQFVQEGDLILAFEGETENVGIEKAELSLQVEENKFESLKSELDNLIIYAKSSGYIQGIEGEVGDELSKGHRLTTIIDKSKLRISGFYHGGQIDKIKIGDKADIQISEFFQTITGTVIEVKKIPIASDNGAISYEVIAEIDNPGGITTTNKGLLIVSNQEGIYYSSKDSNFQFNKSEEVKLKTSGDLLKLHVKDGGYIEQGDIIAELRNSDLLNQLENEEINLESKRLELSEKLKSVDSLAVYAPVSGIVTKINVTEGERVGTNSTIAVISDLKNLEVVIPIDELDINKVTVDQRASVTANAVPETIFTAKVSKIALIGDTQSGVTTYNVTLDLSEIDGLKPGMTANGEVIIKSKKDTLLLPINVIQQRRDRKFVLIKSENEEPEMIPVEIGLVSEDYVEIISGLKEGDTVIYPITKSNSNNTQQRGMNFGIGGVGGLSGGQRPQGGRRSQ